MIHLSNLFQLLVVEIPTSDDAIPTGDTYALAAKTDQCCYSGCPTPQRIATYSLSPNRQRPLAGAFNAAIFNTFRRFSQQVLYVAPPFIAAYAAMNWAVERYVANTGCPIGNLPGLTHASNLQKPLPQLQARPSPRGWRRRVNVIDLWTEGTSCRTGRHQGWRLRMYSN